MKENIKVNLLNTAELMDNMTAARYKQLDVNRYIPIIDLMLPHILNKDVDVLDVGIREGAFLKTLKEHGFSSLHGVDIYEPGVASAIKEGFDCKVADAEELDFGKDFDVITMSHVLEHCPDMIKVTRNLYDHLKLGGILYIEVPQEEKEESYPTKHAHYFNFTKLEELEDLFGPPLWHTLELTTNENGKRLKIVTKKVQ